MTFVKPFASKGNGSRLRSCCSLPPWISPQSSSSRAPSISTRWHDPVTSQAAP
jgi:hypothetical protein